MILATLRRLLLEKEVVDRVELRALLDAPNLRPADSTDGGEHRPEVGHVPSRAAS